jgi:hypothetical protein
VEPSRVRPFKTSQREIHLFCVAFASLYVKTKTIIVEFRSLFLPLLASRYRYEYIRDSICRKQSTIKNQSRCYCVSGDIVGTTTINGSCKFFLLRFQQLNDDSDVLGHYVVRDISKKRNVCVFKGKTVQKYYLL